MGDSFLAQKLATFVESERTESWRKPFTLKLESHVWSVALSGPWLFAVKGTSSYPLATPPDLVVKLLTCTPVVTTEVEVNRLKEWCGSAPEDRAYLQDRFCAPQSEGALFGKLFDRRRLRCLLDPIPFTRLHLWDATDHVGVHAIGMESKGKWRAYLAGVSGDVSKAHPVFDPRPEGSNLFDLMQELADE